MVKLSFKVIVSAEFQAVWKYFCQFDRITEWDPNTTKCVVQKKQAGEIGSQYVITSRFMGSQSEMMYKTVKFDESASSGVISLFGENNAVTATDDIECVRIDKNTTSVEYRADICLKGFKVLLTPLMLIPLNRLTENARLGCIKKATELFGNAK